MNTSLSCGNNNNALSSKTSDNNIDRRKSVVSSLYSSSPSYTSINQSSIKSSITSSICSINTRKNIILNSKNTSLMSYLFGENDNPELCSNQELHELFDNIRHIEKNGFNYQHYSNNNNSHNVNITNINISNNCNNIAGNGSQIYFQRGSSLSNANNNSVSNIYESLNSVLYNTEPISNDANNNYLSTRRKLTPTSINSSLSSNNIIDDYYSDEYICEKKCNLIRKHLEKYLKQNLSGYELCKLISIYLSLLFQTPLSIVLFYDQLNDELIGSFPTKGTWNNYIPKNITNRWFDYKTTCKHNNHICEHNKYKLSNNMDEKKETDIEFNNSVNKKDYFKVGNSNISKNRRATFPPQTIGNKIGYKSKIVDLIQNLDSIENNKCILMDYTNKNYCESEEYDLIRFSMSTVNSEDNNNKSFLKQIVSQGQKQNFYYFNYTTDICEYIVKNNYNNISNITENDCIKNCENKYKNIRIIKDDKNDGVDNLFGLYFYNKLRDVEQLPCDIAVSTQCNKCVNMCNKTTMHQNDFEIISDNNNIISNINSNYIETTNKEYNNHSILNSSDILNGSYNCDYKNMDSKLLSEEAINNSTTSIVDYPVILVSPPSVNNDENIKKCCICENNDKSRNRSSSILVKGTLTAKIFNSEFSDTDINIDTSVNLYQRYSNYKIPVITCPIFDVRSNNNKLIGIIVCLQPQNPNISLLRNLILEIQSLICLFIECKKLNYTITQLYIYNELHRWVFKPLSSQKKYILVDKCELSVSVDVISRICHYINMFTPVQYYLVYINKTSSDYVCIYGPKKYIGLTISKNKNIISRILKCRKVIIINNFENCELFENEDSKYKIVNSAFIPIYLKNENVSIILQLVNRLNTNGTYLTCEKDGNIVDNMKNCYSNSQSNSNYFSKNKNEESLKSDSVSSLSVNSRITYSNKSSISSLFNFPHSINNASVFLGLNGSNKCNTVENIYFNSREGGTKFLENKYIIKSFTILDLNIYKTILRHLINEFQQEILLLNMYLYYKTIRNSNNNGAYSDNHRLHKSIKNNFGIISLENDSQNQSDTSSIHGFGNIVNLDNDHAFSNNNYDYYNIKCDQNNINDDSSSDTILRKDRFKYKKKKYNKTCKYYDNDYDEYDISSNNDDHSVNIYVDNKNNNKKQSDIKSLDSYKKPKLNNSVSSISNTSNNNNNTTDESMNASVNVCNVNINLSEKTLIINHLRKEIEKYSAFDKCILDKKLSMYRELEFPLWIHNWNVHKRFLLDLFLYMGFTQKWNWNENNLTLLFDIIHDSYNKDVPYHNIFHALQVVQVCYIILRKFGVMLVLNDIQKFTLIFAALCHDIDHPGVNNLFLKECSSKLAVKYNDNSILENHHCNYVFKLLDYNIENTDIRNSFTKEENVEFRRLFIKSILSTDMSNHSKLLNILQEYVTKNTCDNINSNININDNNYCDTNYNSDLFENDKLDLNILGENIDDNSIISIIDKELLIESLLHASDISNPIIPFETSKKWASLIQEEFKLQAELEKQYYIPITPFMDVNDELGKIEAQIGFLEYAVIPQWKLLSRIIPMGNVFLRQAEVNREIWFEKRKNYDKSNATLFNFTLESLKKNTISGNDVLNDKIKTISIDIKNKIECFRCRKYKLYNNNITCENYNISNSTRGGIYSNLNRKKLLLVLIPELEYEEYINVT
ncbi:hypothetical protein FG386_003096 [Cryptosporidium ryanae]|uniref:uncharacterized protein n=1 Tax=Cryptosporidium ryanae TaxID=515981 RepID=UPI00351A5F79|nr:hypothetical protein FG386_003096 [Cryptosporidium ryanae]